MKYIIEKPKFQDSIVNVLMSVFYLNCDSRANVITDDDKLLTATVLCIRIVKFQCVIQTHKKKQSERVRKTYVWNW